ncbi:MAG TPA: gliding motility protein GldC [Cyclobacteriaceae bacterium]|nr:gliding motility protein GldC [Cyclobacteriaceae bacterium]
MRKTEIKFSIELDDNNVPEKIYWDASDKPDHTLAETKSISVAVWDHQQKNTLRIDLWSKDMAVDEMERFSIECIGGLAQTVLQSTGDEYMANEMNALCDRLVAHIRNKRKG